jgi:alpha-2-macroglobulin-like protein
MTLRPFRLLAGSALTLASFSCGTTTSPPSSLQPGATGSASTPVLADTAAQAALRGAPRQAALPTPDELRQLEAMIDSYHQRSPGFRGYLMVDKPLYQPGETIWLRADARADASLTLAPSSAMLRLLDPKGGQVVQAAIAFHTGIGAGDITLPADAVGGEYTLELTTGQGAGIKRPIIVSAYEPPRLKKTLEMLRKAYGPGDTAAAAIEIFRTTGEPFARQKLTAMVTLDDAELIRIPVTTDEQGRATVRFELPRSIVRGDALLTVLADDAGFTESIQKRVPIVLSSLRLSMFPEGGDLVAGLPGRVYVAAENLIGKPADIDAVVVDDQGRQVTSFSSVRDGLGRFELTPQPGRTYKIAITRPVGIAQTFDVPAAAAEGCVLTAVDDFAGRGDTLDVAATCSKPQTIYAVAQLRGKRVASAAFDVPAGVPAVVALPADKSAQGAVRVTLFAASAAAGGSAPTNPWLPIGAVPMAERLVYRGRGQDLKIEITPDRSAYIPRQQVALKIKASDLAGKPVATSLGVSVVDDTVLALADDKTASIKAHLFLESELPAAPIEDPNFYFSDKPEAAAALDMLMGTKGYRRFDWQQALAQQAPMATAAGSPMPDMAAPPPAPEPMAEVQAEARRERRPAKVPQRVRRPMAMPAKPAPLAAQAPAMPRVKDVADLKNDKAKDGIEQQREAKEAERADDALARRRPAGGLAAAGRAQAMDRDEEWAGDMPMQAQLLTARVFPIPDYRPGYDGPRSDFRETIFWAPDVRTAADGTATVTFPTSDAITSFKVVAEGASLGGLPGRGEALIKSELPLSLDTKLPLEVSAGDKISLPVSLTNKTDAALTAVLDARFGAAFKLGTAPPSSITLAAGEKRTLMFPLEVVARSGGEGEVSISVTTAGLKDSVEKKIKVVPLGFPIEAAASGTAKKGAVSRHVFDTRGALPGTMVAQVTLYPSPLASMTKGTEAILREPSGCFEQTSSSNYPNVMAMQYMATGDADPKIVARARDLMGKGYKILAGYETKDKGYEWFGQNPGHEALTAYGLMEFEDMAQVHDEVDRKMIDRTAAWLMSRRDGKGGFQRNDRALDSFGRASAATTNGYIVWALTEAKRSKEISGELEAQASTGLSSSDPYLVALAANSLLNTDPARGAAIAKKLVSLQAKGGNFPGAKETITMSGGESLEIETAALAMVAMMKASPNGEYEPEIRNAVTWLNAKRDGYGSFGSTQGTVLALKALTRYADYSRRTAASGAAIVRVNGKQIGRIAFDKGEKNALEFADLAPALVAGSNTIEIELEGEAQLPYSVSLAYRSAQPASSPRAKVDVVTQLAKDKVALGEGVRLHAEIINRTQDGIPMTLARIGLPGGLTFQTWQLKELKDKGVIDFYETGAREVVVYLRAMAPGARKAIDLDLLATLPGSYVAPATSAYLYYTDEDKTWAAPTTVTVTQK